MIVVLFEMIDVQNDHRKRRMVAFSASIGFVQAVLNSSMGFQTRKAVGRGKLRKFDVCRLKPVLMRFELAFMALALSDVLNESAKKQASAMRIGVTLTETGNSCPSRCSADTSMRWFSRRARPVA